MVCQARFTGELWGMEFSHRVSTVRNSRQQAVITCLIENYRYPVVLMQITRDN